MPIYPVFQTSQKIIHAYHRLCEPVLEEFHLPQVSFDILMFLTNNPEYSTAQEISEIRHIKKNLVSVHVEKLVGAGLLQRNPILDDRRKIALSCTEKAKPIIEVGIQMQQQFYREITLGITEEQRTMIAEIGGILCSNANRIMGNDKTTKKERLSENKEEGIQ